MDKQSLILIAMELDLPSIINFCKTSNKVNKSVCKNKFFWINKLKKDYDFVFKTKRDPKEYYKLLFKSVDIDKEFDPNVGLILSSYYGYDDLVEYFLDKGAADLENAAIKAAETNNIKVLDILIPKMISEDSSFGIYDLENISIFSKNMKKYIITRYKKKLIQKLLIDLIEIEENDEIKKIVDKLYDDFEISLDYDKQNILNFIKDNYWKYF